MKGDRSVRNHQAIFPTVSRKELQDRLAGRTAGSIEYKFQNISAVLEEDQSPWIEGYKPARNYQALLAEEVRAYLKQSPHLRARRLTLGKRRCPSRIPRRRLSHRPPRGNLQMARLVIPGLPRERKSTTPRGKETIENWDC